MDPLSNQEVPPISPTKTETRSSDISAIQYPLLAAFPSPSATNLEKHDLTEVRKQIPLKQATEILIDRLAIERDTVIGTQGKKLEGAKHDNIVKELENIKKEINDIEVPAYHKALETWINEQPPTSQTHRKQGKDPKKILENNAQALNDIGNHIRTMTDTFKGKIINKYQILNTGTDYMAYQDFLGLSTQCDNAVKALKALKTQPQQNNKEIEELQKKLETISHRVRKIVGNRLSDTGRNADYNQLVNTIGFGKASEATRLKVKIGEAIERQQDIAKLEKSIEQMKQRGSDKNEIENKKKDLKKLQSESLEELVELDAPKLSKWGKVSSFLAGLVFGAGIAALAAGLVSNPVGWAIIGLGALAILLVVLYHRRRGTGKSAALWACGGALVGGVGVHLLAAGAFGAAAASAIKSAGSALTALPSNLQLLFTTGQVWGLEKTPSLITMIATETALISGGIVTVASVPYITNKYLKSEEERAAHTRPLQEELNSMKDRQKET